MKKEAMSYIAFYMYESLLPLFDHKTNKSNCIRNIDIVKKSTISESRIKIVSSTVFCPWRKLLFIDYWWRPRKELGWCDFRHADAEVVETWTNAEPRRHCSLTRTIARRMDPDVFKFDVYPAGTKRRHCFPVDALHSDPKDPGLSRANELRTRNKKRVSWKLKHCTGFTGYSGPSSSFASLHDAWGKPNINRKGKEKRRH